MTNWHKTASPSSNRSSFRLKTFTYTQRFAMNRFVWVSGSSVELTLSRRTTDWHDETYSKRKLERQRIFTTQLRHVMHRLSSSRGKNKTLLRKSDGKLQDSWAHRGRCARRSTEGQAHAGESDSSSTSLYRIANTIDIGFRVGNWWLWRKCIWRNQRMEFQILR